MTFHYLASPYSHPDSAIRHQRYEAAAKACAWLVQSEYFKLRNHAVYSPIVNWHHIALNHELPKDYKFWIAQNETMLHAASGLIILCIDGWDKSHGINHELWLWHEIYKHRGTHWAEYEQIHMIEHPNLGYTLNAGIWTPSVHPDEFKPT
jgi:hypothetical protein